jgi:LytS/YehU family sensor histidine kinase
MQTIGNHISNHFLFNTLNSINSFIIENKTNLAANYISKFGKLLRLSMAYTQQKSIALQQELEAIELYLCLEKMRFPNQFEVNINVDKQIDSANTHVPPFLLIPYLEYAIWQSVSSPKNNTSIQIDITLHLHTNVQYIITQSLANATPKLFEKKLPHLHPNSINYFNIKIENKFLYNDEQTKIGQQTMIVF